MADQDEAEVETTDEGEVEDLPSAGEAQPVTTTTVEEKSLDGVVGVVPDSGPEATS